MPTVLIVDDEPAIRSLLRRALESAGHRVLEAEDGPSGLELALRERPDAALLDIALPGLSGTDVCRWLKRHEATAALPVLLITGVAADPDRQAAQAGAVGVLTKPFGPAQAVERVAAVLRERAPAR